MENYYLTHGRENAGEQISTGETNSDEKQGNVEEKEAKVNEYQGEEENCMGNESVKVVHSETDNERNVQSGTRKRKKKRRRKKAEKCDDNAGVAKGGEEKYIENECVKVEYSETDGNERDVQSGTRKRKRRRRKPYECDDNAGLAVQTQFVGNEASTGENILDGPTIEANKSNHVSETLPKIDVSKNVLNEIITESSLQPEVTVESKSPTHNDSCNGSNPVQQNNAGETTKQDTDTSTVIEEHTADTNLFDIFCVQSQYHGSTQQVPNDKQYVQLQQNGEATKRRQKKKRLPDIKKKSSKVSIKNDTALPPIPTTVQNIPAPPCRQTVDEDREAIVDVGGDQTQDRRDQQNTEERHKSPLWICKLFFRFPIISFVIVTLCHLAVIATTVGLFATGYDVFPIVFDDLPLYIHNDVRLKELAWRERSQVDGFIFRPVSGYTIASGTRSQVKDTVEIIFDKDGGNLLNSHDLTMIKMAEDRLFNHNRFQSYFCLVDYTRSCVKPQSILRLFDGTYMHVDQVFNDRTFSDIPSVIYKASLYNETRDFLYLFLGKGSHISPNYVYTPITRTFFLMGWPLGKMENRRYGTFKDLESFLVHEFKPEIENVRDQQLEGVMDVYYLSKVMLEYDLVQQALKDILLAIGSISFIFLFMCFQTGSLTITFFGILSIVSSFLWTNLIYRYVFQYVYFGFFHVIALFLILGIGADDLFVFYDTWRLTGHNTYPSDAHRLSDCYRRAAKTTFVTSCTTMVAFLVSGLSPLLPVRTFGIFAGVLVGINYLWVIIYFPVIILLHHIKFKHMWRRCHGMLLSVWYDKTPSSSGTTCGNSVTSEMSSATNISETNSANGLIGNERKPSKDGETTTHGTHTDTVVKSPIELSSGALSDKTKGTAEKLEENNALNDSVSIAIQSRGREKYIQESHTVELNLNQIKEDAIRDEIIDRKMNKPHKTFENRNRVVNFLKNGFFDFMTLRVVKFVVPVLFVGTSIFFIVTATGIEPDTHQLRLFRSTHNYAQASDRHYFSFMRNHEDEYQRLYLVWGLEPADIGYCNLKSGSFCHGKTVIDRGFSMESAEAQVAMKNLCNSLKNFDPDLANKLRIRRDTSTNELQIGCFTTDFDKYFEEESQVTSSWSGSRKYPATMNLTMPVTSGNVSYLIRANPGIYWSPLQPDFDKSFQVLISYWMTHRYSIRPTSDFFKYNNVLGEHRVDGTKNAYYSYAPLYYGTRTLYVAVEINTTLNVYSLNYKEGMPIFRQWESFMDHINDGMPAPLQNGFQVTENLWHWIYVQETLANSAVIGILIGLFSAWPILVLTTLNFVIGTIAAVTIGLVTSCVVGLIPLVGWRLGVLESINLCMVVGLSVDYVVHLAEAYRMSESPRRLDRVRNMLESIGLSVISGAITTIGAAVFMLFAQIQFFFQFGIFIISTVGISLLFSLFCFTTFMSLIGPQGDTGSLTILCSCLCKRCRTTDTTKGNGDNNVSDNKSSGSCVSPAALVERIFDWFSYRADKLSTKGDKQTSAKT